ncbi:MAG: hypothetical protein SFV15_18310 [Polyangiaceae bacterium]|nr:hypothetical protein [Polyangiaceae bacterium]
MNAAKVTGWVVGYLCTLSGCTDSGAVSEGHAKAHVKELAKAVSTDVGEVRRGLPLGALCMGAFFNRPSLGPEQASDARDALAKCQNKVQDLRVAKSTFFAAATADGTVLRNDREQDLMAGKSLFGAYPELRQALTHGYVETEGSMPEASGVKGKPDAQWVAGSPVKVDGQVRGLYATGWSWSAYAYRLEFALRSSVRGGVTEQQKEPLVYVFVVSGKHAYGAPVSPRVSAQAVEQLNPLATATEQTPFSTHLEITGRTFGLAVIRTPSLGKNVGIAVLRSET